ncbi:unnamed protein product [Rotaria magnacalcarata]|uniref:Uncharacterized protein n=1 Tax=Rotaria magnacalcarata TaxID=392030 RepID=A0A816WM17_9BILA|nr:unnamed protein product [Rotaria magnacalcarata]CAF1659776.1 unnamed protein product [Rotaria magnacalcarata]CAF2076079.1 unnamed protein product [Rotaria magnacalcarata]CAF2129286.1 unnamed protein product [Rotaria magnacalcarata]CAF2186237.1 unnamed protein product [Rotaria magnacalcarata]
MDYHSSMCNLTILQTYDQQRCQTEEQHNVSTTLTTLCRVADAFDGSMLIKDSSPIKFIDDIDTDEEMNIPNSQEDNSIESELLEQQEQQHQEEIQRERWFSMDRQDTQHVENSNRRKTL